MEMIKANKRCLPLLSLIFFACIILPHAAKSQATTQPDSVPIAAVKLVIQGLWAGPDESYYLLFRGDSVKEWETDGADSVKKPYCRYILNKDPCDTVSAKVQGTTGVALHIICYSNDYDEVKCYFIQSITTAEMRLGVNGEVDESGIVHKVRKIE